MPDPAYIGADPGKSGALAVVQGSKVEWTPMPIAGTDIDWAEAARWLRHVIEGDVRDAHAVVELVHSSPQMGVKSAFSFGTNFGGLLGVLGALAIPYTLARPQRWKQAMLAGTKREKADAVAKVRRLYPELNLLATERSRVPHDGGCEAILMALYGKNEDALSSR